MAGETQLHRTLKKEACRWLLRAGYRCIAAEVRLRPLGIIDAVGTGVFRPYHNYLCLQRDLPQVCFVECKASRADFLRDTTADGQMTLCLMERERNLRSRSRKRALRASKSARAFRQGGAGEIRGVPHAADGQSALSACARRRGAEKRSAAALGIAQLWRRRREPGCAGTVAGVCADRVCRVGDRTDAHGRYLPGG